MKFLAMGVFLYAFIFSGCSKEPMITASNSASQGCAAIHLVADSGSAFDSLAKSAYVVVHAAGMDTIRQSLTVGAHSVTGTISNIPAGPNRIFDVFVLGTGNAACYFGEGNATVIPGVTVTVKLTIYRSDKGSAVIDGRIVDSLPTPQCFVLDTQVIGLGLIRIRKICNGDTIVSLDSFPAPKCTILDTQVFGNIIKIRKVCYGDTIIIIDSMSTPPCIVLDTQMFGNKIQIRKVCNGDTIFTIDTIGDQCFTIDSYRIDSNTYRVVRDCNGLITIDTIAMNNPAPQIVITSPDTNSIYPAFAYVPINVSVKIFGHQFMKYINVYMDSAVIGSTTSNYYSNSIYPQPGWHTLTATVTLLNGIAIRSAAVKFMEKGPSTILPSVAITSPKNNALYRISDKIVITATATDSINPIRHVEFYCDSTFLGSDSLVPYSFTLKGIKAGAYQLWASADDNTGARGTSQKVQIVVK